MDAFRVFNLRSDPRCDVICLETNRRVSAVLHCDEAPQLLLLNGGSESEQLHVDVLVPAAREPLCLGSHELEPGRFTVIELTRPARTARLRVRIIGSPEPIVLDEPEPFRHQAGRLASAAALVLGFAALLVAPNAPRSPAAHAAAPAPHRPIALASGAAPGEHRAPPRKIVAKRHPAALPLIAANYSPPRRPIPQPLVAVSTPLHVLNGEPIAVAFRSTGQQVRIVAKIGPRTIEDRIIGASRGKLLLAPPPPSSDVRVLTIDALAQKGGATSSRVVIVILLPDAPPSPALTNL